MRWMTAGLCALCLVGMTGCAGTYGVHGRLGRAMRKDLKENYLQQRTCPKEVWDKLCEEGEELSEECIEACFE